MSLDERVRDGLRRSAERGGLDADEVLADVQVAFLRGERRRRGASEAVVVVVVLALFGGVAALVSLRASRDSSSASSDRWQSTATVRVAAAVQSTPTTSVLPDLDLLSPAVVALAPATREAALASAHIASAAEVEFHASSNRTGDIVSLTTIAPTASEAAALTRSWAEAFATARRYEARSRIRSQAVELDHRATRLHNELVRIDAELIRIDPKTFNAILRYDAPTVNPLLPTTLSKPPVPENASVHELNLENERVQLISELASDGQEAARFKIAEVTPEIFATLIAETPATLVSKPHASNGSRTAIDITIVALAIVLAGAGAAVFYRRRKRTARQVAA